jgi:phage baseplate assembly protein W
MTATDPQLLTDLLLSLNHHELRPVYRLSETAVRVPGPNGAVQATEVGTAAGRDNLGQAVVLRLLTPLGELASLAHPEYGSRLHELVGRQNTETTRHLVKLFVLQSLQLEPRISQVTGVDVRPSPGTRDRVDVTITVVPLAATTPFLVGPISLGLAP